jgi:diadenosine tetraphosphate (Ap4A) HIT family hydrolase
VFDLEHAVDERIQLRCIALPLFAMRPGLLPVTIDEHPNICVQQRGVGAFGDRDVVAGEIDALFDDAIFFILHQRFCVVIGSGAKRIEIGIEPIQADFPRTDPTDLFAPAPIVALRRQPEVVVLLENERRQPATGQALGQGRRRFRLAAARFTGYGNHESPLARQLMPLQPVVDRRCSGTVVVFDHDAVALHARSLDWVYPYTNDGFHNVLTMSTVPAVLDAKDYKSAQARLQARLAGVEHQGGLGAALDALRQHQVETGFIRDDLSEVIRHEFCDPVRPGSCFSTQFNPARARRFAGAGRTEPPEDVEPVHDNCFLCAANIEWQQQGREMGYALTGGSLPCTAWMNPFPLAVGHAIIASDEHISQHWLDGALTLETLVRDLLAYSRRLPGWIVFYNGVGAGASIEGHFHLHALPRTSALGPLPIEIAAGRQREGAIVRQDYPVDFAHWRGSIDDVLDRAGPWLAEWERGPGATETATANVIGTCNEDGRMDLYFVPRHRRRSRGEGLGGVIGAFETMGEIICSTPDERARIESGQVNYRTVHKLLAQVAVALD